MRWPAYLRALTMGAFLGYSAVVPTAGLAQSVDAPAEDATPSLVIELNDLRQIEAACRLVFMANNTIGQDLQSVSFETVLVGSDGVVDRLTVFDFQDLPDGRMRVRQFELAQTDCGSIGAVLINGAASCDGEGVAENACMDALSVSTRTNVEIMG